ncbi:MAG: hypothetical protein P1U80_12430 [Pseudomonadales bacterium]|nr:hypothetical protein [Pseudomonadales bacterium]
MTEHRLGINPGFMAKHTLTLSGLNQSNKQSIVSEIDQLPCVDDVSLNEDKQTLRVAYDASHHNIDEMIAIVEKHGGVIKDSWWSRTKLGWQRQTDDNIKENAKHEAACCSKMPPGFNNKR